MSRAMNASEKLTYRRLFPLLDVNAAVVTDEETPNLPPPARPRYNCLAWTLGITNSWVWPGPTEADFDRLYTANGFVRATSGTIAAWGYSQVDMKHGSIHATGPGPDWESKLGEMLRIRHGRDELRAPPADTTGYGSIRYYYRTRAIRYFATSFNWLKRLFMARLRLALNQRLTQRLADAVSAVPAGARERFDTLYERWHSEWNSEAVRMSSDPAVVKSLVDFPALKEMGPVILPLLAQRLTSPHEFFALQLFEEIAPDPVRPRDLDAGELALGEQHRALRNVQHWLASEDGLR